MLLYWNYIQTLFGVPCVALIAKIKITDEPFFKSGRNFCKVKNAPLKFMFIVSANLSSLTASIGNR